MAVGVPWAASSPGYHALDSILTKVPLHIIFNHFKLSQFSFLLQFLSQEKIQKSPQIITHSNILKMGKHQDQQNHHTLDQKLTTKYIQQYSAGKNHQQITD